ncbi:MAG: YbaB/EbfC family nucleoid-associated protein [Firmicutes bacterium]|nr:YbaB/EbfC family nucleoid-associated protein [Bacillota bacterium]
MQNMGALVAEMQKLQAELRNKVIEVVEGNGAVKIKMNGHQEVVGLTVAPDLLAGGDTQRLELLLAAALNRAIHESKQMIQTEIARKTGFALPQWTDGR